MLQAVPPRNRAQLVLLPPGGMQTLESAFSLLFALQVMRSELQARVLNRFFVLFALYKVLILRRCRSRCAACQVAATAPPTLILNLSNVPVDVRRHSVRRLCQRAVAGGAAVQAGTRQLHAGRVVKAKGPPPPRHATACSSSPPAALAPGKRY